MGVISAGGMDSELISTAAHRPRSRVRWGRGDQETPAGGVYKDGCFPCSRSFTYFTSTLFSLLAVLLPSRPHSTRYLRPTNQGNTRPSYLRTRTSFGHLVHAHTRRPSFLSRWPLRFSPSKSIHLLHGSLLRQPPNMFSTTAILRSLHKLWHCHRYIPFIIHLSDK
jgi:hypothetical protein